MDGTAAQNAVEDSLGCHGSHVIVRIEAKPSTHLNLGLIDHVEHVLRSSGEPRKLQKRVVNVLIECAQNLYHHDVDMDFGGTTSIEVGKTAVGYCIVSSNQVRTEKLKLLKKRLSFIAEKSPAELRKLQLNVMQCDPESEKGAGLGLIDIARRSQNKVKYQLTTVSDELSQFTLQVTIPFGTDKAR